MAWKLLKAMRTPALAAVLLTTPLLAVSPAANALDLGIEGVALEIEPWCEVRDEWIEQILATHEPGTWATMKFSPTDAQLAKLGFPSAEVLRNADFSRPTMVMPDGTTEVVDLPSVVEYETGNGNGKGGGDTGGTDPSGDPAVASYAGLGCFGIRPGALLLTIDNWGVGWCSMAHVYGAPGSYQISTAGHCGGVGDTATVVAAFGNRNGVYNPIILDFGKYAKSTGDGGVGNDWALIDVYPQFQDLVTPTMCFWGGPLGMYTKTGALAHADFSRSLIPTVSATPDPFLAQTIVHYGHGTGVGFPAGTARAAEAIYWGSSHFMFVGAISPGDSGSGSNALSGDGPGAANEAAGINTHLYVDPLMRDGLGVMAGTRATLVQGTLANGQIVPYPAPVPGAP